MYTNDVADIFMRLRNRKNLNESVEDVVSEPSIPAKEEPEVIEVKDKDLETYPENKTMYKCPNCGRLFPVPVTPDAEHDIFCPVCGKEIDEDIEDDVEDLEVIPYEEPVEEDDSNVIYQCPRCGRILPYPLDKEEARITQCPVCGAKSLVEKTVTVISSRPLNEMVTVKGKSYRVVSSSKLNESRKLTGKQHKLLESVRRRMKK